MEEITKHLSFSNVVAVFALFIALGGSAYAVKTAQKDSVTSKSIKNEAIKSKDVKDGALTAGDIDISTLPDPTTGRTVNGDFVCTNSGDFNPCVDTEIDLTRSARLLVIGEGSADSGGPVLPVVSICRIFVDGNPIGSEKLISAEFTPAEAFTITAVSDVVSAGIVAVELDCRGPGGGAAPRIFGPTLTTVVLGAG